MEIAPPQWRGRMVGLLNCGYYGGSISAAAVTFGTNYISNDWAWRIPVILQAVPAMAVIFGLMFMPRVRGGSFRTDKATRLWRCSSDSVSVTFTTILVVVEKILISRGADGNNDPASPLVALEWQEFEEKIELDASDKRWWDYRALFATHNARWRFAMVMFMR